MKANGGGTVVGQEGLRDVNPAGGTASIATCNTTPTSATNSCQVGYIGGTPYFGRDLNGDGDRARHGPRGSPRARPRPTARA